MKLSRTGVGCGGALMGAIALTIAQIAYFGLYYKYEFPGLLWQRDGIGNILRVIALLSPLFGGALGVLTTLVWHSFRQSDAIYVLETMEVAVPLALFGAGAFFIMVCLPILGSAAFPEQFLLIVPLFVLNAPLQWAIALAVCSKIALNRLRAEERRAQYEGGAGAGGGNG